jgi:hypothetical protein
MAKGKALPVNNDQIIQWKTSTQNQFHARARAQGPITRLYSDRTGHKHFQISIGSGAQGMLEVIYNQAFGALPSLKVGMSIEACGDYITSYAQSGQYPPSPDGAILHWVHRSPKPQRHESGYVAINGKLYGQGDGNSHFLPEENVFYLDFFGLGTQAAFEAAE